MNFDFIPLYKLGVGNVLVRYSEIVTMEPTVRGCTLINLSLGEYFIVEQGPLEILNLIDNIEQLKKLTEEKDDLSKSQ